MTTININDIDYDDLVSLDDPPEIIARLIKKIDDAAIRDNDMIIYNRVHNQKPVSKILVDGEYISLLAAVKNPTINRHGLSYQCVYYRLRKHPDIKPVKLFNITMR